jgi:nicotinate-nucleotide adenylyltransferase
MRTRNLELRRRLGMTLYGKPLTRRPRIGIYPGQFDPIHYGHLSAAHITRIRKNLDQVLFVTCNESPNDKPDTLPAEARHAMVVAATAANPFFQASRIDLRRKGTSYMINTVEGVIEEYGEDADLFAMISSEYLNPDHKHTLSKWIGAKELFAIKQLTFSVFPRDMVELEQIKEWAKLIPQARIEILDVPSLPLSSTMIRQWVLQGRSIWYTTPWNVQQMIYKNGYYRKPGQDAYKHESPPLSQVRRVGIYPGAFDPITYGDLLKAEWARQEHNLDRVAFVTSASPPNNRNISASAENRHDMVVAATADNPYFDAWRTDIESGRVSYTLQTVEEAKRRFGKDVELYVLLRADYLNPSHPYALTKWMGAQQLFKMCKFIAFPRDWTQIEKAQQWAKCIPNATIEVVYAPSLPVESDFVRELVGQGHSTMYCTPWDVQQLITKSGSYGADEVKVKRRRSI